MRRNGIPLALFCWLLVVPIGSAQIPVGTAIEYQGYLLESGGPANGAFDFQFDLYDSPNIGTGTLIGTSPVIEDVTVADGLFSVTIDFGATAFGADARWVEIDVRPGANVGAFSTLNPRQRIRPTPFSLATRGIAIDGSGNADFSGTIHTSQKISAGAFASNSPLVFEAPLGTERARISDTGQFGIGETSPLTRLHVQGVTNLGLGATDIYTEEDVLIEGSHAWLGLHSANTSNPGSGLALAEHDSTSKNFWWLYRDATGFGGNLHLSYGTETSPLSSTNTEVMQLSPSGRVGIGGTSTSAKLFVQGTSTTSTIPISLRVYSTYLAGVFQQPVNYFLDLKGTQILAVSDDTDSYTTLSLNPEGGNVAIGTTFSNVPLTVQNRSLSGSGSVGTSEEADVSIVDDNAWLSLKSDDQGGVGSGIELVESGSNKWAMFRRTTSNVGDLVFTYGTSNDPTSNDVMMQILPDGTTKVKVLEIVGMDVAERFPVSERIEAGTVVEIDPDHAGQLRLSSGAYNRRVAGVVSGAGDIPVGAILGSQLPADNAPPIALSGRVWVHCDTSNGPIEPGDLLTTADLGGHAMKVTDFPRAQGAIIGKAMTPLKNGRGLVLVLVSLQ